jgi:RES domain-containing protein
MPLPVESIAVVGEWVRHAPHRSAPLGRPPEAASGRWQRGDVVPGLYLADEPETAVAEWYRWLAENAVPPRRGTPHDHHRWRVSVEVVDLTTPERLAAVNLSAPLPASSTWTAFQEVGESLWREGWRGLLAPSAARPRGHVLCLFADVWPPRGCRPVRVEEIAEVPVPPMGMTT